MGRGMGLSPTEPPTISNRQMQVKFDVVVQAYRLKFTQCMARSNDIFVYPTYRPKPEKPVSLKDLILSTFERELAEA